MTKIKNVITIIIQAAEVIVTVGTVFQTIKEIIKKK